MAFLLNVNPPTFTSSLFCNVLVTENLKYKVTEESSLIHSIQKRGGYS